MKRIKSLFLIVILIIAMNVTSFSTVTFSDVRSTDWFYDNLLTLTSREIIDGFTDGTFRPNDTLKLDQYIKLLVSTKNTSIEVDPSYWAYNFIQYGFDAGILDESYSSEITYDLYNQPINRYEAIYLLGNYFEDTDIPEYYNALDYPFYDLDSIPKMYLEPLFKCYALGIISGYPDGEFKGENTLTRAEATAIISRILFPQQRLTPLTVEEVDARYILLSKFATGELEENTNINNNITLTPDTITYNTPYSSYPLDDIVMPSGQKIFLNKLFTAWNSAVIDIDDAKAYLSTSINETSFRMSYQSSESSETTLIFSSDVNGDTMLTFPYDLELSSSSSAYTLLELLSEKYDSVIAGELVEIIVSEYNTANNTPGYNDTTIISNYEVTTVAGDGQIFITLSYPQ